MADKLSTKIAKIMSLENLYVYGIHIHECMHVCVCMYASMHVCLDYGPNHF